MATETEAAAPLVKQFTTSTDELIAQLTTPQFYVEMIVISIAMVSAFLIAKILQIRMRNYVRNHPPKRIDPEFLTKPLALLSPIIALVLLGIAKPFADKLTGGSPWVEAASQLTVAYLIAKCVVLILSHSAMGYFIGSLLMIIAVLDVSGFMKTTTAYLGSMSFEVAKFKISFLNLIHGIIILVIVFWIAGLSSRTLESYLRRSSSLSYSARELIVKFFKIFVYFVAFIVTLSALGVDLTAFAVFSGALGVGIGLGLQKITANFVSGVTLLLEKSIKIGDLIEVGGVTGWVRQLNIRYALVEASDGRELMVPNEELISTRVTNWTYSSNKARIEINLSLTPESDPELARQLMIEAAKAHPLCQSDPPPAAFLMEFGEASVKMRLTFWIPNVKDGRLGPQSEVMFTILQKFKQNHVVMAYQSRDVTIKLAQDTLDRIRPPVPLIDE